MSKRLVRGLFRTAGLDIMTRRASDALQSEAMAGRARFKTALILNPIQISRFLYLHDLLSRTAGVPGDVVECGVGKGISFTLMALSVMVTKDPRNLWGFDSFEGFPEPTNEDRSPRNVQAGQYNVSLERVQKILKEHLENELFLRTRTTLVKGFFDKTLPQSPVRHISLLNLDVDLYESYKYCLEQLWPRLSPGGIVTFDEYVRESFNYPGAVKAIDEFFADKNVTLERCPYYGKYYVVKSG